MLRHEPKTPRQRAPACLPTVWWVSGWEERNPPRAPTPSFPQAAAARAALSASIAVMRRLSSGCELSLSIPSRTVSSSVFPSRPHSPAGVTAFETLHMHPAYPYRVLTFQAFLWTFRASRFSHDKL